MDKSNRTTRVWFVLLMLFVVLGPLGLPFLWKSPRFSRGAKIALTIATVIYTGWILLAIRAILEKSLQGLSDLRLDI